MQWKRKNRVRHLRNQARSVGCGGEEGERLGQTRLVPCFPHPSPVIYNRKTSIPRRAESLINSCRFIKRALQIIILLFFSHLSQEKSFHLATHFPFPWRPFFRLSRKPLITSIARDSSYREKVTRFLFESRDREREANQMHRLKSFDRGTVSERYRSSLRYRNGNWHHFHG